MENKYINGPYDYLFIIISIIISIVLLSVNKDLYKYVIFVAILLFAIKKN